MATVEGCGWVAAESGRFTVGCDRSDVALPVSVALPSSAGGATVGLPTSSVCSCPIVGAPIAAGSLTAVAGSASVASSTSEPVGPNEALSESGSSVDPVEDSESVDDSDSEGPDSDDVEDEDEEPEEADPEDAELGPAAATGPLAIATTNPNTTARPPTWEARVAERILINSFADLPTGPGKL